MRFWSLSSHCRRRGPIYHVLCGLAAKTEALTGNRLNDRFALSRGWHHHFNVSRCKRKGFSCLNFKFEIMATMGVIRFAWLVMRPLTLATVVISFLTLATALIGIREKVGKE